MPSRLPLPALPAPHHHEIDDDYYSYYSRISHCRGFGTQPARNDSERSRAATTEVGGVQSLQIADELLALLVLPPSPCPPAQALMESLSCMTREAERLVLVQRSRPCINIYALQEPLLHMRIFAVCNTFVHTLQGLSQQKGACRCESAIAEAGSRVSSLLSSLLCQVTDKESFNNVKHWVQACGRLFRLDKLGNAAMPHSQPA